MKFGSKGPQNRLLLSFAIASKVFLFSGVLLFLPLAFKRDFKIPPSHPNIPFNPDWESSRPSAEIMKILNSPFSYYSRGNQTTVFISEDGEMVLKIFRYRRSLFPLLHWLKNGYKSRPKQNFRSKLDKTFNAAHLACHEGQAFTHVLYCHLNLTKDLLPTATLKVGKKIYLLPLDQTRFVLQRKADPFKMTLLGAKDDPEKMRHLIKSFVSLLIQRSSKNIRNSDPNLWPNFGFLNGEAVEIDFGNYQKIAADPKRQKEEVCRFLISLEEWLAKQAPEYLNFAIELRRKAENAYDQANEATSAVH